VVPRQNQSNVWIAEVVQEVDNHLGLQSVSRVQSLPGQGSPFARLANLLSQGDFDASAIDAPFSVPSQFVPAAGHGILLQTVAAANMGGVRSFPLATTFVNAVTGQIPPLTPAKPLRETEIYWQKQGVNIRSTLWAGVRGGAPMTSACLTLLHRANCALWPWTAAGAPSLLIEAFPAGQLRHWRLPHQKYNGPSLEAQQVRQAILANLQDRIDLRQFQATLLGDADALDAVLCTFAAIAVTSGHLGVAPGNLAAAEGWIAVHD
jgi:hypothetical protein